MPTTEKLVIDLPSDVADLMRSRMSSGKYASESAVIEEALLDTILPAVPPAAFDEWIRTEGVRRYDAMRADPTQGLTHDEFWSAIEDEDGREDEKQ